jgi:hypothetical protein
MSGVPVTLYEIEDELIVALDTLAMIPDGEPLLKVELEEQIARLIAAEITKVDAVSRNAHALREPGSAGRPGD